jgi:hypothetical protein
LGDGEKRNRELGNREIVTIGRKRNAEIGLMRKPGMQEER